MAIPIQQIIDQLLTAGQIEPVLVDVGASGGTPKIWQPIRAHSTYVGFDPDTREMRRPQESEFRRFCIVNEVITAEQGNEIRFFLTRSPYCSSTLRPNPLVTDNFLSADSFIVEREETLKASSLNAILDRLSLGGIDWMKIDTQGTDLRIYNSLRRELRDKLLAIDIEPGLRGAYVGEDLFSDVHKQLAGDGFWLSNLKVCGLARMRKTTLDALTAREPSLSAEVISRSLRQTPGWTECRYLRSLESLAKVGGKKRDYLLLWVFALIDKQFGFCLDLAIEYTNLFGTDEVAGVIRDESIRQIDLARLSASTSKPPDKTGLLIRVRRKMKRVLSAGRQVV
jgi:hypothetical protein